MRPLLVLAAVLATARALNLTVLHTNDVHSRFEEFNAFGGRCPPSDRGRCYGGVARQFTKVAELRSQIPNTLFLNAGDYFQGTMWFTIHKEKIVSTFMNRLNHDIMALGNHEFDDGVTTLTSFLKKVKFPVLACNLNASSVPEIEALVKKHHIFTVDDTKIGVVGYITPETKTLSSVGSLEFSDEIECLRKEVEVVRNLGVNIIIALGHSGFTKDKEICEAVEGIDVVVGGHTDTFLYTGKPPSTEVPVDQYPVVIRRKSNIPCLVVQDFTFGKYIGVLNLDFNGKGDLMSWFGNPILLDPSVKQDPNILETLAPFTEEVERKGGETVGHSRVLLRGDRQICRARECNMGNLLTDACIHHFLRQPRPPGHWSLVATAFWNSGGIRASIDEKLNQGNITREDVMAVAPFSNTIDIVELYGKDVRAVLEHAVRHYDVSGDDMPGAFLQVAGARITFDISLPPGHRVVSVEMRCARCRVPKYLPLNDSQTYNIAVPSFLIKGGDGFSIISQRASNTLLTNVFDLDIIFEYLASVGPVTTGLEDRIQFVSSGEETATRLGSCGSQTSGSSRVSSFLSRSLLSLVI